MSNDTNLVVTDEEHPSEVELGSFGNNVRELLNDTPLAFKRKDLPDFVLESDGSIPTWKRATERFERRLRNRHKSRHDPRFSPTWARQTRARLLRADQQIRNWCDTTILLTFTGSPFVSDEVKKPIPPTYFISALTASRSERRDVLRDVLCNTDGRWVSVRVIGAHQSGFPHEHVFIGSEATVSASDFEPVINAHVDHSPIASQTGHDESKAIRLESEPSTEEPTGGIKYVAKDIPGVLSLLEASGSDQKPGGVVDEPEHRMRMASVLEATGMQAVRTMHSSGVEPQWY